MQSLNSAPYFDDFDETKDFHKILYKPGIPVQARELTQVQSILQTQISRFGDHIFVNGARVSGGQVSANNKVFAAKLINNTNLSGVENGVYLKGDTSGLIAEVVSVTNATYTSSPYVVYTVRTTGSNGSKFLNDEGIYFYSDFELTTQVAAHSTIASGSVNQTLISGTQGYSKLVASDITKVSIGAYISSLDAYVISVDTATNSFNINKELTTSLTLSQVDISVDAVTPTVLFGVTDGIFYINGYFARVGQQSIVPSLLNRWCTTTIGLTESQDIIDSDMDSTLLDPAQGSYNYAAPGADRLKVSLTLVSYDKEITDPNFIELMRVENGVVVRQSKNTEYSELMSTIARRTYDESGNYVVSPFIIGLKDEGVADKISAVINPGKAYVGGYEFETITPTKLPLDRALETEISTNFMVDTYIGNFVQVSSVSGPIPAVGSTVNIELAGVVKGTAVFMNMSPYLGSLKMYLANIAGSIASGMTIKSGAFTASVVSDIKDTNYKLNVFPFPQSYVKNVSSVDYKTKRLFKNVVFTNGVATISGSNTNERFSGGTGTLSASVAESYYAIFNAGSHTTFTVVKPAVSANSIDQCQINVGDASYNGTGDIIATMDINQESVRVKTLTSKLVSIPSLTSSSFVSLGYSDLYKVKAAAVLPAGAANKGVWAAGVYAQDDVVAHESAIYRASSTMQATAIPGVATNWVKLADVSSDIVSDNGQKDGWYDHAAVKSKSTAYTNLLVLFDYFSHSGNGIITVNSYPVAYTSIPSYTTSGNVVIELKDAIDSRPRRKDNSTTLEFDSFQVPDDLGVELSVEYYLSRIDKIVLTNSRSFKVVKGVSSYSQPLPPADVADAMTLAVVLIPPYTNLVSAVQVRPVSNRRYTMRDIGVLAQRIGNVEYYTSINNLESSILNSTQYAPNGSELFKSGFIADNFESFNIGNVLSPEYKCSIDVNSGICRPQFKMGAIKLDENSMLSNTQRTGNLVTLPYTSKSLVKNVMPTSAMNVNPFSAFGNIGTAILSPSSDYWFDEVTPPQVNIVDENTGALLTAQKAALNEQQVQWGSWVTNWTGASTSASSSASVNNLIYSGWDSGRHGTWQTFNSAQQVSADAIQYRSKEVQSISSASIVSGDGTKVVSRETQPFIRAKDISFKLDGMNPLSELHVWVDDVLVDQYVTPAFSLDVGTILSTTITAQGSGYTTAAATVVGTGTGANITPVITDGKITGLTITDHGTGYTTNPTVIITGDGSGATATASITVPSKGDTLVSDKNGHSEGVLSFPAGVFTSGAHQVSFTDSATSNRSDTCEAIALYTADGYIDTTQRSGTSTRVPMIVSGSTADTSDHDPMAQTFFIEQTSGVFAQSVDLFFASKDQSTPVTVEIRPTVNGYPSNSVIVPMSVVTLYPADINTSTDGTVPTTFTFESPVYLTAGEYALVITSGSNKYTVYVAEMNKQIIGTTKVISDQPYIGSLFESQNASANTADQFKDLCFELRVCEFVKGTKTLVLRNTEYGVKADVIHAIIQNIQPANTSITAVASLPTYSGNFVFDTDVTLSAQSAIAAEGDASISITMNTTDANISPVIDLERTALICVENIINDGLSLATAETAYQNGGALAKYASSRVVLNQGFNASNIVVYVNVNRPQESAIEVYFRAKNEFDTDDLSNKPWVKLTQEINAGNTSQEGQYVEDKWSAYDYTYDSFTEFNMYEVKVVMYSSNTSRVPVLADIRAIALA